jgi:hypothetical protein
VKVPKRDKKKQLAPKASVFSNKYQKDVDQDTLADMDDDYMIENLLEDEKENEKVYENILKSLSNMNEKENEENDYINQVDIDDLENLSLSTGSALSSFIDWDQIDNIIGNFE